MTSPEKAADVKSRIDELVSSLAGCDKDGCRCWQAVSDLQTIAEYAQSEIQKHGTRVGIETSPSGEQIFKLQRENHKLARRIGELEQSLKDIRNTIGFVGGERLGIRKTYELTTKIIAETIQQALAGANTPDGEKEGE